MSDKARPPGRDSRGSKVTAPTSTSTAVIMAHLANTLRALVFSDDTQADTGGCPPRCPWCDGWPA